MKVEIRDVQGVEDHDTERIILDVKEDTDIGKYIVFDATYTSNGRLSNKVRHTYWFPDKEVKKGDVVVLYTKEGKNRSLDKGTYTLHLFYWGLGVSVWNNEGDYVVLVYAPTWEYQKVN